MKKKIKIFFNLFIVSLFIFSLFPYFVVGQERKLEVKYPEIGGIKPETTNISLVEYVKYIFSFFIVFSGVIIFAALLWASFLYLTSAGNPAKMSLAKERILSASLGLILLLSSYLILVNINPQFVIFNLPFLEPLQPSPPPQPITAKPEEISLIATELPLGQMLEKQLWSEERIGEVADFSSSFEEFLTKEETIEGQRIAGVADLNKFLQTLTEKCRCEELIEICTKPQDFAMPVQCTGDPCPASIRTKIENVIEANELKAQNLQDFFEWASNIKFFLENDLRRFQDLEEEIQSCQEKTKLLFDLGEHLSRMTYFKEQGWQLETLRLPNTPPSNADPLTFYCSIGGNIFDVSINYPNELPLEFTVPELFVKETPEEAAFPQRISCPVEIPLGETVDNLRELAASLVVWLEKLMSLTEKITSKVEKMTELASQCNANNCQAYCNCIYNPCFEPACGISPTRVNKCGIGKCTPPTPVTPNFCFFFCDSPCLQTIGTCSGVPCPREEIAKTVKEIKELQEQILEVIPEINNTLSLAVYHLEDPSNKKNLKNLRLGISLCHSSDLQKPTWGLFNCQSAIGNYGPGGEIIGGCHPRNYFCCLPAEEKITFPWTSPPSTEMILTAKKYKPLPSQQGCPQGWTCDSDVANYNQYNDASEPLKQFLSCMRERLDIIQKQENIGPIGRISSISDSKIYKGTCDWLSGPNSPGGCSHKYENKYGKLRVSAHYGGTVCRVEKKSYAVDFGDEENAEYLIKAIKECRSDAYINFRTPGHYDHLHVSLGRSEGCGGN